MFSDLDPVEVRGLREYVRQVANALGLSGPCWFVQAGPPANVYLALDDRLAEFPTRDLALLWDEEHGWALGLESMASAELVVLGYLGAEVLPTPDAVAASVRAALADPSPGNQEPPVFRDSGLAARLAAYAGPRSVSVSLTARE